ncbi:hypothetical protein HNP84_002799 [Thermocatellispora tengchongensis]|uniref:Uncharacterized protein n=1 Tax=Thermocatellispora tengchongensis TaxID=1073253 RepID=A0A840P020_9ACTN|nr:hypothetical protein [Thermocatellispora tengchongensis]
MSGGTHRERDALPSPPLERGTPARGSPGYACGTADSARSGVFSPTPLRWATTRPLALNRPPDTPPTPDLPLSPDRSHPALRRRPPIARLPGRLGRLPGTRAQLAVRPPVRRAHLPTGPLSRERPRTRHRTRRRRSLSPLRPQRRHPRSRQVPEGVRIREEEAGRRHVSAGSGIPPRARFTVARTLRLTQRRPRSHPHHHPRRPHGPAEGSRTAPTARRGRPYHAHGPAGATVSHRRPGEGGHAVPTARRGQPAVRTAATGRP